jgi:hypothetical protein
LRYSTCFARYSFEFIINLRTNELGCNFHSTDFYSAALPLLIVAKEVPAFAEGLPDEIMGLFTRCDWQDITYKCCLPHDLAYGYGEPGNDIERERVDLKFYSDLVTKAGMKKWLASAFLAAVRTGGREEFGLSFSWGFAGKTLSASKRTK